MKKIILLIKKAYFLLFGKLHNYIHTDSYMKWYTAYLKQIGVRINGTPCYISSDAYFDGHYYGGISIGDGVTISTGVMFLVHDYSIVQGLKSIDAYKYKGGTEETPHIMGTIEVGANSFIGAKVSLLPGTKIGTNCIIGACSVVKGVIPDNCIVIGNPGKIVADTKAWATKKMEKGDFYLTKHYE